MKTVKAIVTLQEDTDGNVWMFVNNAGVNLTVFGRRRGIVYKNFLVWAKSCLAKDDAS
jgi:hypothetical protein